MREERDLLRIVIDSLPNNIYVKDTNGRFLVGGIGLAHLLGVSAVEDLIGKSDFDFFPHELAAKYYADEQSVVQSGQQLSVEEPVIDQTGGREWLLTTKVPLRGNDGNIIGIVGLGQDITGRKKTERALIDMIKQVEEISDKLVNAVAEILATTGQEHASITVQDASINQTFTAVTEMQSMVDQVAERADAVVSGARHSVEVGKRGRQAVADSIGGMQRIRERTDEIAQSILALSEKTQQIGEIITSINAIANQSKLLALNASIEASRSGEEGKGFAVVAMEVRNLAEQSRKATGQADSILNDIRRATNTAVITTKEGLTDVDAGQVQVGEAGRVIEELDGVIKDAAQAATLIAVSIRQQKEGMNQLSEAMAEIRQVSLQSEASTRNTELAAQGLNDMAQQMQEALDRYQPLV